MHKRQCATCLEFSQQLESSWKGLYSLLCSVLFLERVPSTDIVLLTRLRDGRMARVMVCPPPVGWHANCADCDSQYLSVDIQRSGNGKYSGQMSDDEAQEELKNVLESTADAREALSGLLKAHGDVILTR